MAPRCEAVTLMAVVLVLCALCAWAVHAVLAPENVLAYANLLMLCQG
jgi:hypothetical protein